MGIAAAARLWPGLVILALWLQGYRKSAVTAGAVAVGLNLIGFWFVTPLQAMEGLGQAGDFWSPVPWPLWLLPVLAVVVVFWWRGAALPLGIAASPIAWPVYYLSVLPRVTGRSWLPLILIGAVAWIEYFTGSGSPLWVALGGVWLAWLWRKMTLVDGHPAPDEGGRGARRDRIMSIIGSAR